MSPVRQNSERQICISSENDYFQSNTMFKKKATSNCTYAFYTDNKYSHFTHLKANRSHASCGALGLSEKMCGCLIILFLTVNGLIDVTVEATSCKNRLYIYWMSSTMITCVLKDVLVVTGAASVFIQSHFDSALAWAGAELVVDLIWIWQRQLQFHTCPHLLPHSYCPW